MDSGPYNVNLPQIPIRLDFAYSDVVVAPGVKPGGFSVRVPGHASAVAVVPEGSFRKGPRLSDTNNFHSGPPVLAARFLTLDIAWRL